MKMEANRKHLFPIDPWAIIEESFDISNNFRNETIFALGNGYIGSRATFEEAYDFDSKTGLEGNFINGFYESEDIRYGEFVYGCPKKSQSMLNVANAKIINLFIDDEAFDMRTGKLLTYNRKLNLKTAVLERTLIWESPKGKQIEINIKRLVSFEHRHLMAIRYDATLLNSDGILKFVSKTDTDVINHTKDTNALIDYGPYGRVLGIEKCGTSGNTTSALQRVKNNRFSILCETLTQADTIGDFSITNGKVDESPFVEISVGAAKDQKVGIEKFITYFTSLDTAESEMKGKSDDILTNVSKNGFTELYDSQIKFMSEFWNSADVKIIGDNAMQQGIRFNIFHLLQGAPPDSRTSMAAKCLTGEGYEGHYFWDTEMYMINPFISTSPEIAKNLLDYRYNTLPNARDRARQMGHETGALFPWRTINGNEASAYYPQGTAQYHINGDISYALWNYLQMTGDTDYLVKKGAEIFIETARLWYDLGAFVDTRDGRFCISDVTGPDEYTSIVDNNFYTNSMAEFNLTNAYETVVLLKEKYPAEYQEIAKRLSLSKTEHENWLKAAKKMYYHYNEKLQIFGQDDTFLYKKPIDKDSIPEEKLPMLMNFHPLVVYRYRVAKQADLLLAMLLLSDKYSLEEKRRHYDFYEKVTLHDSSLSPCIFSILAFDIGYCDKGLDYFNMTSRLDLDDYHKNVHTGIHAANMAGTWMSITQGFAGMRIRDNMICFKPWIPEKFEGYSFKVKFRGREIEISVKHGETRLSLLNGDDITVRLVDNNVSLSKGVEFVGKI